MNCDGDADGGDLSGEPRVATTAIPGMTLAEIRYAMGCLRSRWDNHCPKTPICPTEILKNLKYPGTDNELSLEEFARLFVLGHHIKRVDKKQRTPPPTPP